MATPFTVPKHLKLDKAKSFTVGDGKYVFPFVMLDPTPGGTNLGRIEWCVELVPSRKVKGHKSIEAIALWTQQTRDPRYVGKVFYLQCFAGAITSRIERDDFVKYVWYQGFCEVHGFLISKAYPKNDHVALVVDTGSSISNDIYFEKAIR